MITTRAGLFYSNFYFLNLLQPLRGFQAESLPVVHKDTGGVTAAVILALVIQKIKEKLDLDGSVYPELYQTEALITEIKKSIYGSCTLNVAGEFFSFLTLCIGSLYGHSSVTIVLAAVKTIVQHFFCRFTPVLLSAPPELLLCPPKNVNN